MKIQPHCSACMKKLKSEESVVLADMYFIQHTECFAWQERYILDKGTLKEVVSRHEKYFKGFLLT